MSTTMAKRHLSAPPHDAFHSPPGLRRLGATRDTTLLCWVKARHLMSPPHLPRSKGRRCREERRYNWQLRCNVTANPTRRTMSLPKFCQKHNASVRPRPLRRTLGSHRHNHQKDICRRDSGTAAKRCMFRP